MPHHADALGAFAGAVLAAAGLAARHRDAVAETLVEADLLGYSTHGLAMLPLFAAQLEDGRMARDGEVSVVRRLPARALIDGALRDAGVHVNVVMELRSIPGIVRMVATTRNLAFVSRVGVAADNSVQVLEVDGLDIRRRLAVVTRRGAPLSPAASSFATTLRETTGTP